MEEENEKVKGREVFRTKNHDLLMTFLMNLTATVVMHLNEGKINFVDLFKAKLEENQFRSSLTGAELFEPR